MRRSLVPLLVLVTVVLGGCGDDTGDGQADDKPRGQVDFTLVEVVTETAVDGMVSAGAAALDDPAEVTQFVAQFEDTPMEAKLTTAFADLQVSDDQAAYAAVVAIGCEIPKEVVVTATDSGILIEPVRSVDKPVECFAPMTSVAVVSVDKSVVD